MADIDIPKGSQLLIQIGDGATPEVFSTKCMINTSRGISWSSQVTQNPVVDCDNPEEPAWLETEVDGLGCTITGAGRHNTGDEDFFDAWFISGDAKNVRFKINKTGGSYWQGAFKLTEWSLNAADRNEKGESSITLMNHGRVTRADV